ncbi:hypothetical protein MAHJHV64_34640 [Mycobacterium avium subsp. hominissuis]
MSRPTASSIAQTAACIAARDPSTPTTIAGAGYAVLIATSFTGRFVGRFATPFAFRLLRVNRSPPEALVPKQVP